MTFMTSPEEIYRRFVDEAPRCYRWGFKESNKAHPKYEKLQIPDTMDRLMKSWGYNFVGYVPYTCPKNGDKWYSLMMEEETEYRGCKATSIQSIPVYMWETVGSFGFVQWMQLWDAGHHEPGHTHYGTFMFTSHCMQRLMDRLCVNATPMQVMLFCMALIEYSVIYVYKRGKRGMVAEIANQFGVFRIPYHDRTDRADIVKTFLPKEKLNTIDRKRYDRMWQRATTEIFGHWQMSMPANVLPNK